MNELPPSIKITEQMLEYASLWEHNLHVRRTKTSKFDTKIGLLGEFAFAYWLSSDWKWHHPLKVRGQVDFFDLVEIKTSAFKFSPKLHLLVRQDYAVKRSPKYYLQLILDMSIFDFVMLLGSTSFGRFLALALLLLFFSTCLALALSNFSSSERFLLEETSSSPDKS